MCSCAQSAQRSTCPPSAAARQRSIADITFSCVKREVASRLDHWSHKGLNNRAENSHLPFRKRERSMQGVRTPGGLQRFVSIHSPPAIALPYHPVVARP